MKIVVFKTVFYDNEQILSVLNTHTDYWNKGDLDACMEGYWKSDDLVFTSGGKITNIFNKMKEGWRIVHDHTSVFD